jgi:hypothetical protein
LAGRDGFVLMHRMVVHDAGIEIPDGWHVHHKNGDKIDNRLENLEVKDPSTHSHDHFDAKEHHYSRRTHCNKGHEFTPANTMKRSDGGRRCRECDNARHRVDSRA